MAAGEGCNGPLAGFLGVHDQLIENTIGIARGGQHFCVAAEVGAQCREVPGHNLVHAHSLEIELRAGHRQQQV